MNSERMDRLDHIENEISKTPLYGLLGADGIAELKSRIIDIICDEVQRDLHSSSYYIISPDDINETLGKTVINEAVEEIKAEYKDAVKNYMAKQLEKMME